ncbi:MAG: hypothetical protein CL677_02990 [Bdellovibrionaceae bacterium]|nr:hypothetical protein [Pseudobdellovibrionaceae bacterium]
MKSALKWAILLCLVSIGVHMYSTYNYYPVKLGIAQGESSCNINDTFSCDAVTTSSYSAFLGVPMSLWGALTHGALLLILLSVQLGFTENRERWMRLAFATTGFIALTSLVMAAIAFIAIGTLCPNCIGSYVLSFLLFFAVWKSLEEPFFSQFKSDLSQFGQGYWKDVLLIIGPVLISGFLVNQGVVGQMVPKNFDKIVENSVQSWKANPAYTFDKEPALTKGNSEAKIVITEFADFLCPHCKTAASTLKPFLLANKNRVKLNFYSFPLDGTCNDSIGSGSGKRCRLSAAVLCANEQGNGWPIHDDIFAAQRDLMSMSITAVDDFLKGHAENKGIDVDAFMGCLDKPETIETLKSHAALGANANVKGTPSIYINGKYLPGGQLTPVLDKAINSL